MLPEALPSSCSGTKNESGGCSIERRRRDAHSNRTGIVYYRYERIVQDIGESGESVFLNYLLGESARGEDAAAVVSFFEPGGAVDAAEVVGARHRISLSDRGEYTPRDGGRRRRGH